MSFALALLLAGSAGCSVPFDRPATLTGPDGKIAVSVVVVASNPSMTVGQTGTVAATVKDAAGEVISSPNLTWTVSAPQVATVSIDGTVTALSPGSVRVIAGSGTVTGETTIQVVAAGTPPVTPPVVAPPTTPTPAQLPQLLDTSMPTAPSNGGQVRTLSATDDLQAAIDAANPGDVIELPRGATYTGHYVLPNKGTSTAWIVIRPAAGPALPAEGTRMTPALAAAANLPRIISSQGPAFATTLGAHHYRLIGLELTVGGTADVNTLVALGTDVTGGQTTTASIAHDLVLDRMYIHGNSTIVLRRCVALNSATSAVIDSYLSDCHERSNDSQAIMGWNGPGPFKIVNNYLEGAGEIMMFGGSDPGVPGLIPSDIEVRHNHFRRPVSWNGVWLVKNLFELKNARRVLVEGNVFENNWAAAQDGTAILLKSTNQDGTCTWCGTSHVTFRMNIVRNVKNGMSIAAHPETFPVDPAHSIAVYDNIFSNIDSPPIDGTFRGIFLSGDLVDVWVTHNTLMTSAPSISLYLGPVGAKLTNIDFSDNVLGAHDSYGIFGDNQTPGGGSWTAYVVSGRVVGNVFTATGGTGATYPTGNFFATDNSSIGFANLAGADFHLLPSSPFKGKASDGKDPGANVDAVLAATNGVVIP